MKENTHLKKQSPPCKEEGPEQSNDKDGDRSSVEINGLDSPSSQARMGRDADSGDRMVSGHAEEG